MPSSEDVINGTLIAAIGPAGCGKTYTVVYLLLRAARLNGIPFLAIDPAGEVKKYVEGFRQYAQECGDSETVRWLSDEDCVRCIQLGEGQGLYTIDEALDIIENLINGYLAAGVTEPQCVIFLDELAWLRQVREGFQNSTIPKGRNAGCLFGGTCQTPKGLTPKAWACSRAVMGWKTTQGYQEIFDRRIDNDDLTSPQSDSVKFVLPWERGVFAFDLNGEIPKVFSHPVTPTGIVKRRL